jgi:hypothetical protein
MKTMDRYETESIRYALEVMRPALKLFVKGIQELEAVLELNGHEDVKVDGNLNIIELAEKILKRPSENEG